MSKERGNGSKRPIKNNKKLKNKFSILEIDKRKNVKRKNRKIEKKRKTPLTSEPYNGTVQSLRTGVR